MLDLCSAEVHLQTLAASLKKEMVSRHLTDPLMVGVHRGGAWVASWLHQHLGLHEPLGQLDISFYRDDFSKVGLNPHVQASTLPVRTEGRDIVLIDDVFYTGRTIRAALNEIFDYGRPRSVILGVLLERNGREIPIRPDCVGGRLSLADGLRIKLEGPAAMRFSIHAIDLEHERDFN